MQQQTQQLRWSIINSVGTLRSLFASFPLTPEINPNPTTTTCKAHRKRRVIRDLRVIPDEAPRSKTFQESTKTRAAHVKRD